MINKLDFASRLSDALDLLSPKVVSHHKHVAYISIRLAIQLGMTKSQIMDLAVAALLHDCGAISCKEKELIMDFHQKTDNLHALRGYRLLKMFAPFSAAAEIIKFHHVNWKLRDSAQTENQTIPIGSEIIFIADRVDSLIDPEKNILEQASYIRKIISDHAGEMFAPYMVHAFLKISESESFWLDYYYWPEKILSNEDIFPQVVHVNKNELLEISKLYCRIIDFRSEFTASHSVGLASIAATLAQLIHFPPEKILDIKIAGYLHDLGKLAVSKEILEKPAKLTMQEQYIIKAHSFFTYKILQKYPKLKEINTWASLHHERLDGTGYPFKMKGEKIHLGSRIIAVADVFTAITENRPYRKGMTRDQAIHVLKSMANSNALDKNIVDVITTDFSDINEIRKFNQLRAYEEHRKFLAPANTNRI